MSRSVYAVSDIHGFLDALDRALEIVDLEGDPGASLVLLGDYVDRGPSSRQVLERVRALQRRHGERVVALRGNHDCWLIDWLDGDDEDCAWLRADAGFATVRSFVPEEIVEAIPASASGAEINATIKRELLARHGELIDWLRGLPVLHEAEHAIYVHAGVDEEAGELWRAATPERWLTEKYPASIGPFAKTIVAGHVRTAELHADGSHGVFHDGASHFYIDAAVEVTGQLNVLRFDADAREFSWQMTPPPGPPSAG